MNNEALSKLEQAALDWLNASDFAQAPMPVRLPDGRLCLDYWHAEYMCYGALLVVETLTDGDMLALITAMERHITQRQNHDYAVMIANGTDRAEAQSAAYGHPTRAAVCVPFDEIDDDGYEGYARASGTFDEPMVIAMWDGDAWSFQEEEVI